MSLFQSSRTAFHRRFVSSVATVTNGFPANADSGNKLSITLAQSVLDQIGMAAKAAKRKKPQTIGHDFESAVRDFVESCFSQLSHIRPGPWEVRQVTQRGGLVIAAFEQYSHLIDLDRAAKASRCANRGPEPHPQSERAAAPHCGCDCRVSAKPPCLAGSWDRRYRLPVSCGTRRTPVGCA